MEESVDPPSGSLRGRERRRAAWTSESSRPGVDGVEGAGAVRSQSCSNERPNVSGRGAGQQAEPLATSTYSADPERHGA